MASYWSVAGGDDMVGSVLIDIATMIGIAAIVTDFEPLIQPCLTHKSERSSIPLSIA